MTEINPHSTAKIAGHPLHPMIIPFPIAFFVSTLATDLIYLNTGLAGFAVAAGQEGRLTQAFYQGYGFSGILIAFLARNNPLAATVVALLVAALFVTGRSLQVFYQVPFSMVQLIQAVIVVCVASSDFFIRHRLRRVGGEAVQ